ncbi:mannose-1-phosphate guanylyltransferase/mannose-6-phosphate isomerase [Burkholderia guangdongensis]|uniref:mannose-1-phosphate guanylyltransferase/mannose-6-phosphate isomerase n=1 Tax=Burkholderia guangdongensis TaxID=1792500 RepID=UPI0015CC31D3|nr:mannose-1-phosphate guanylyltransferase/mannose-6-phosphate isomerase [Burkholderia guangdongensis]
MNAPATAADTLRAPSSDTDTRAGARVAVQPVILAGGSGTRLWPMSREHYPKQLIGLLGEHSLLQATACRLDGLTSGHPRIDDVLVVCGEDHRFTTAEQLRVTGKRASIVLEPLGRDTAPALTLAALRILADKGDAGGDAVMTVMPADHAVADLPRFHAAVAAGVQHAAQGRIATMGIVPTHAETGYGYIRVGASYDGRRNGDSSDIDVKRLERFVEKPHLELARKYVASGEYWWNSGIFIVRASVWLNAIRHFAPAMLDACERAIALGHDDGDFFRVDRDAFASSPSNSIDYAVMEPLSNASSICETVVVPLDAGWSDVGSWDAIWQILPKDGADNVARGHVLLEDAESTFVHSESRLVACVGTQNLVVVETPDAVLVADKSRVQDVKKIVGRIKAHRGAEATDHRKVHRPWGHYDSVDMGERFQVKRIVVKPGARLSLQMHHHRAEHWIVVRGTARITRGDETFLLSENESTFIPLGVSHRLENPGMMPLELIEVQSGSYLGEDDIVRFDDTYGRQ